MYKIKRFIYIVYIILSLYYYTTNGIDIIITTTSYTEDDVYTQNIINDFNKYSKKNNLGINLKIFLFSSSNITVESDDYSSIIEGSLKKNSQSFDLMMMDVIHTKKFEKYTADLKKYVSKELIDSYSSKNFLDIIYSKGKVVGLPLKIDNTVLYSNKLLLDKYNKTIPKTWDELINTALDIINEEKKIGKDNLIGYIGHFPSSEVCICSALEFIYSFRDNVDDDFPSFLSTNAENALNKIMEIKEKISSNENFQMDDITIGTNLFFGKPLFAKFWNSNVVNRKYYVSPLPGHKEGISASCIGGYILIVNKKISEEKKKAAGKVIEFLLSKDVQKEYMINKEKGSARYDIYSDEELCSKFDCKLYKSLQHIARPSDIDDYQGYSYEFRKNIQQFLYDNKLSIHEALRNIESLSSSDQIRFNTLNGYFVVLVSVLLIFIVLLSYGLIYTKKFQYFTKRMNKTLWFFQLFGLCITGSYGFFMIGSLDVFHCSLSMVYLFMGSSFIIYPFVIIELIYFPEINKISQYAKNHSVRCILFLLLVDLLVYGSSLIVLPFHIERFKSSDGMFFRTCIINSGSGYYIYYFIIILIKAALILLIFFLTFIEWNLQEISREIKITSFVTYSNILFLIMFAIIKTFRPSDLYTNLLIRWGLSVAYTVTNYVLIVIVRIFYQMNNLSKEDTDDISFIRNSEVKREELSNSKSSSNKSPNVLSKFMGYHYLTNHPSTTIGSCSFTKSKVMSNSFSGQNFAQQC